MTVIDALSTPQTTLPTEPAEREAPPTDMGLFAAAGVVSPSVPPQATTGVQTYIPLYRKYRPQSFADVMGQAAIVQTLSNAITHTHVAHAYLFCGPRGTGKTSTARIFAKSLNCAQGPTVTPCQTCASCTGVTQGQAIDVVEFDAASNNSVDDARELIENCQFAPMAGRYKIYIIDEVHMLSTSAFNALLKTLEEPPPNVIFIFATTEIHKVLPTIISRCQRFDFSRITAPAIADRLRVIAASEAIPIAEDGLMAIARLSKGGLRDAVGMLDQLGVMAQASGNPLTAEHVVHFMGGIHDSTLLELSEALYAHNGSGILTIVRAMMAQGVEPLQLVKALTEHLRHLFLTRVCLADASSPLSPDALQQALGEGLSDLALQGLMAQAPQWDPGVLSQALEQLSQLDRTLKHTADPELWMEVGLVGLCYSAPTTENASVQPSMPAATGASSADLAPLQQRITQLEQRLASLSQLPAANTMPAPAMPVVQSLPIRPELSVVPQSPPPLAAVAPHPALPQRMNEAQWQQVVQQVGSPLVRSMLKDYGLCLGLEGETLTVGITSEVHEKMMKEPARLKHLEKAAEAVFKRPLRIVITRAAKPAGAPAMPAQPAAPIAMPEPPTPASIPVAPVVPDALPLPTAPTTPVIAAMPPAPYQNDVAPTLEPDPDEAEYAVTTEPVVASAVALPALPATTVEPAFPPDSVALPPAGHDLLPKTDIEEAKRYTAQLLKGKILPDG